MYSIIQCQMRHEMHIKQHFLTNFLTPNSSPYAIWIRPYPTHGSGQGSCNSAVACYQTDLAIYTSDIMSCSCHMLHV